MVPNLNKILHEAPKIGVPKSMRSKGPLPEASGNIQSQFSQFERDEYLPYRNSCDVPCINLFSKFQTSTQSTSSFGERKKGDKSYNPPLFSWRCTFLFLSIAYLISYSKNQNHIFPFTTAQQKKRNFNSSTQAIAATSWESYFMRKLPTFKNKSFLIVQDELFTRDTQYLLDWNGIISFFTHFLI